MSPERLAKQPPALVKEWRKLFLRSFAAKHLIRLENTRTRDLRTATLLGALASIVELERGTEDADRLYRALCALFGHAKRRSRWEKAIDHLPPDPDQLMRVPSCVDAYRRQVTKKGGPGISSARFKLPQVVRVIVQIPNAKSYVEDCVSGGLSHPGAMFHPNTLENAKKKFRGAFPRYETPEDDDSVLEGFGDVVYD